MLIYQKIINFHEIKKRWELFLYTLSLYFTRNQNNYDKFRYLIYATLKLNKDTLLPFFISPEETKDEIIVNIKFKQYLEKN